MNASQIACQRPWPCLVTVERDNYRRAWLLYHHQDGEKPNPEALFAIPDINERVSIDEALRRWQARLVADHAYWGGSMLAPFDEEAERARLRAI